MAKPSDEPEKIILQIEEALVRNDLIRASALMESISNRSLLSNNRLQELVRQIRLVQENRESLDRTLLKAEHLLENNDPDQAIPLFQSVIEASPDHSKARIGLQNSRRKIDYRHRINLFIETIRRAREKEDYRTAREYCSEWLQLDPENEKAREIFQDLDRLLNRDREVLVMKNRGSELIDLGRYQEAIDLLEKIQDLSPEKHIGEDLIAEAVQKITKKKNSNSARESLDEAQRLVARSHFESALKKLNSIDDQDLEFHVDISLLKRKAENGLKTLETEQTLIEHLNAALQRDDIEDAKTWLQMITELNPATDIYKKLKLHLAPEIYINLTN